MMFADEMLGEQFARVVRIVDGLTLHPMHTLSVHALGHAGSVVLTYVTKVLDSNRPDEPISVSHGYALHVATLERMSNSEIRELVARRIVEAWRHEGCEWVRFNGKPVIDPGGHSS